MSESASTPQPLTIQQQRGTRGRDGNVRMPRASRGTRATARGRGRGRFAATTNNQPSGPGTSLKNVFDKGTFGDRLTGDASQNTQGGDRGKEPASSAVDQEDEEKELCFICASEIDHYAVAPCNHRTCHVCALRMRALFRTKTCLHCRTNSDFVIFTDEHEKRYDEFQDSELSSIDVGLGIKFETPEIQDDTIFLLRYNCPDRECTVACLGWPDLHRHVRSVHHKVMCDLCTRNKKAFTHEHELFTQSELKKHERFGDDHPGAIDQTGFKGHPECGFCRQRFYGDDELYAHCRDHHEKCHICDRRDEGRRPQYYVDYNSLEMHFRKDHFLCPDRECLEKKFVVFGSEMDLKAHQIQEHPNGLSKDAMRDARRVDLGTFSDLRERYDPNAERRRGRDDRNGRSRGRGRDPNAEPIPASSAQPLRRDELAFQRQMAVQSLLSNNSRTFGSHLSAPTLSETDTARVPDQTTATMRGPQRLETAFPSLSSLRSVVEPPLSARSSASAPEANLTPQEQARRIRHQAVIDRASAMLKGDQPKIAEFRTKISHYKSGQLSANELVESFFTLFDRPPSELGSLLKELADIFEIESKRADLLKAWNDWKAINEDYPSLGGSSSAGASSMAVGGKRVLKLKTATSQSARSAIGRAGGWGNMQAADLFPALTATRATSGQATVAPKSAWAGAAANVAPTPVARPTQAAQPQAPSTGVEAFPALPAAAKPMSSAWTPSGRNVIRTASSQPTLVNPWSSPSAGPEVESVDSKAEGHKKNKGNKNRKQVLMSWG
ncbi:uncharacterized protein PV09_05605 [Verruconis gallopava]|uniref:RING-type E3 ubiquitin transferase n=1 Tax=Verruconis gallopava TaxID=253628 RepID=A0A0D2A9X0_9PEZI|nr:uncharacterized protein PV09_05605 [Verruconis gallopava]KIW03400.1 hypothetical protein PV09_05605 [Verruconis gallopava]